MSNPIGEWFDSMCDTFGWGSDSSTQTQPQPESEPRAPAPTQTSELKKGGQPAADKGMAKLKQYDDELQDKQCSAPDTSDDYIHPKTVDDIPDRSELQGRLNGLKPRVNAITNKVFALRADDPAVESLTQKARALSAYYNKVKGMWGGLSDRGQRLELVPLEREVAAVECEVAAHGK